MSTPPHPPGTSKLNRHPIRTKFLYVSPQEAAGNSKVAINARRAASDVYIKELGLTAMQTDEVLALYNCGGIKTTAYGTDSEDQLSAAALLAEIALDDDAQEEYGNRWSKKWSVESGKGADRLQRVLYQWCVVNPCVARQNH